MTWDMIGLGDLIEAILAFFGIHPWSGCGCESRKAWLNNVVIYVPRLV